VNETDQVQERYDRRVREGLSSLYHPLDPSVYLTEQEKTMALIRLLKDCGVAPVEKKRVLEVGCGNGNNLLRLILLGFQPENLIGNELLEDRVQLARRRLPGAVEVWAGDATALGAPDGSFDIVLQSTVFTSLLDDAFQQTLANRMWRMVKPGGGVLWYDFTYNNPKNPDVRGVGLDRIRSLFPEGRITHRRVTLAPPISRRVKGLYGAFNVFPFLRTHLLCWIQKPGG
jgi:SAM-dependent methyltransferase